MKIENKFIKFEKINNSKENQKYKLTIKKNIDSKIKKIILLYLRLETKNLHGRPFTTRRNFDIEEKNEEFFITVTNIQLFNVIVKNKDINEMIIREILFSGKYILDTLDNNNFSVLSFDLKDFIFIESGGKIGDKTYTVACFFIGFDKLISIETNKKIQIIEPFEKGKFLAPELRDIKSLPSQELYPIKAAYYSLGDLCTYLVAKKNNYTDIKEYQKALEPLLNTKIYWMILRCLKRDPYDRYLLYI